MAWDFFVLTLKEEILKDVLLILEFCAGLWTFQISEETLHSVIYTFLWDLADLYVRKTSFFEN